MYERIVYDIKMAVWLSAKRSRARKKNIHYMLLAEYSYEYFSELLRIGIQHVFINSLLFKFGNRGELFVKEHGQCFFCGNTADRVRLFVKTVDNIPEQHQVRFFGDSQEYYQHKHDGRYHIVCAECLKEIEVQRALELRSEELRSGRWRVLQEYPYPKGLKHIRQQLKYDGHIYRPSSGTMKFIASLEPEQIYCWNCRMLPAFFAFEVSKTDQYRYPLYGYYDDEHVVRLEIDHCESLSGGGSNSRENYQLYCRVCNARKGDM